MLNYINTFITKLNIPKKVVIGVSGGVDSMCLLYAMDQLGFDIIAIHVNHNTRNQNKEEQQLVTDFCKKLNVPLKFFEYNHVAGNFEMEARKFRYNIFNKENRTILTAHHIDDSFEWHLMQKFKSSGETLGIPVKNNNIIRPFMCLTKQHIYKFAKIYKIPFLEDSSNSDISYERNFVRNEIIPKIKEKYPNYLEKYVHQMNERAKETGVHFTSPKNPCDQIQEINGVIHLDLTASSKRIEKALQKLSSKKRGKFRRNIITMKKNIEIGKRNFTMNFSGGTGIKVMKDRLEVFKI